MVKAQSPENVKPPDSNRDEPKERQRSIVIFPYTRAFKVDTDEGKGKKIEEQEKAIVCRVRKSTISFLGLEKFETLPVKINEEGNIQIIRGSVGAKSWKMVFAAGAGEQNTYSFPVPGWVNIYDFFKGVLANIPEGKRPLKVVTPNGVSYSASLVTEFLKDIKKTPEDVATQAPEAFLNEGV
jgi:hypothetical protein